MHQLAVRTPKPLARPAKLGVPPLVLVSANWCGAPQLEQGEYAVCIMKAMTANCFGFLLLPDFFLLLAAELGRWVHIRPLRRAGWNHELHMLLCAAACLGSPEHYTLLLLLSGSVHWDFLLWAWPLVASGLHRWVLAVLTSTAAAGLAYMLAFHRPAHMVSYLTTDVLKWPCSLLGLWLTGLPDTLALFLLALVSEKRPPSRRTAEVICAVAVLFRAFVLTHHHV